MAGLLRKLLRHNYRRLLLPVLGERLQVPDPLA
jgi:hypothetical protein